MKTIILIGLCILLIGCTDKLISKKINATGWGNINSTEGCSISLIDFCENKNMTHLAGNFIENWGCIDSDGEIHYYAIKIYDDNVTIGDKYYTKECELKGNRNESNLDDVEDINDDLFTTVNMSIALIEYEPTLNMSELMYKGEEVLWVYQREERRGFNMKIIPCIMLKNETRYCKE